MSDLPPRRPGEPADPTDLADTNDLVDLADLAEAAGVAAAELLAGAIDQDRTQIDLKSSATDMVTEMDRASETLIVERLLGTRPDDGVLGEEGAERTGTSGVRWVIDPIDGTTNYVYRHPGVSVSIAAELDGRAVAGVVVDIFSGDVFRAVRGQGATRNGRPVAPTTERDPARALLATGFSYDPERRRRQAELLSRLMGSIRDIRRMGSAALDLCAVACGRVDAYYEGPLAPWDFAAGALIAQEAGVVVEGLGGPDAPAAPLLAANPDLIIPLRHLIESAAPTP